MDAILQKRQEVYLAARASFEFDNLVVNRIIPGNPVVKEMLKCLGHYRESKIIPGDFRLAKETDIEGFTSA